MKISNERREEILLKFKQKSFTHWSSKILQFIPIPYSLKEQIANWFFNILDQELSNHTQRVREVITARIKNLCAEHDRTNDQHTHTRIYEAKYIRDLPILNPTKDNE